MIVFFIIALATQGIKVEPKEEDIKLKIEDQEVHALKKEDFMLKIEDQDLNAPLVQPAKRRKPSLFETAERSLRLKKHSSSDISDERSEED